MEEEKSKRKNDEDSPRTPLSERCTWKKPIEEKKTKNAGKISRAGRDSPV